MPRTAAKFTQADIGRAIREMRRAFGSAQVIFDSGGNTRVVPISGAEIALFTKSGEKDEPIGEQEEVDL